MGLPYGPFESAGPSLRIGSLILPASQSIGAEAHVWVAAARQLEIFARDGAVGHDAARGQNRVALPRAGPKGFHFPAGPPRRYT